jgi:uncharacterized protein
MKDRIHLAGFTCTRCGDCCRWSGSVLLREDDLPRMAAFLGLKEEDFIQEHTELAPNRHQLALIDRPDGSCRFLEGNRCRIYEARPVQCSSFPHVWRVHCGCPGLDALQQDA